MGWTNVSQKLTDWPFGNEIKAVICQGDPVIGNLSTRAGDPRSEREGSVQRWNSPRDRIPGMVRAASFPACRVEFGTDP